MKFLLHVIVILNFWIPVALGYNLVFGKGKIFHFGPLGVWAGTAYALYVTMMATGSYPLGIVAAIAMSVLLSLLFAWLALRLEPDAMGVMSIAVHLMFLAIILNWTDVTRGALGIPGIPRMPILGTLEGFAMVTSMVSVLCVGAFYWLEKTAFSRQVTALAEHEWYAKSLGINRAKVYIWSFLILGFSSLIPSLFSPQYLHFLHPHDYNFPAFVFLIMIVVAGKPGSMWGGVISTVLLVVLREGLRFVPMSATVLGPVRLLLFGLILFVAVWYRRDTLFPKQRSI